MFFNHYTLTMIQIEVLLPLYTYNHPNQICLPTFTRF